MLCRVAAVKKSPRTSSIVKIIFSVWSFGISKGILSDPKLMIGLDSFSIHRLINWHHLDNTSLRIDYNLESFKFTVIPFGSMLPNLKGH